VTGGASSGPARGLVCSPDGTRYSAGAPLQSPVMAATRRRVEHTDPVGNDQGDYRPREFGRITWLVKLAEREV